MQQNLHHLTILETWRKMSLVEQMANIGSEVERAMNWKEKNNQKFSEKAFFRALELFDLTLSCFTNSQKYTLATKTEVARSKELFADFFWADNQYNSTRESWQKYFKQFNYLARKNI